MSDPITLRQARYYDDTMYDPRSYDSWLWCLERAYLTQVLDRHFGTTRPRYLDFACGSGRVIAALEGGRTADSTGIDVSSSMLALARAKLRWSRVVLGDATLDPTLLDGPYDLITAFRFFLNAGDALRARALAVLHRALADDGLLVLNVHGNTTSLRGLSLLIRPFRRRLPAGPPPRPLSIFAMRRLLHRHGFEVIETRGFGVLTTALHRLAGPSLHTRLQRLLCLGPARYLAVDLVLVCCKRGRTERR
jgi:SAM-dependent methyltransferase